MVAHFPYRPETVRIRFRSFHPGETEWFSSSRFSYSPKACREAVHIAVIVRGELDYVWLWILCGLPFGLHRMCLWIVPGGGSLGGGIALFALNFIIGGVIGGFVLAWRLIVAVWYVPLTVYRLIVG